MSGTSFWNETQLSLLPGERILYTLEPDRGAIFKSNMLALSVACIFTGPFLVVLLPLVWWTTQAQAKRHQGFVTNQRVVVTNGLIGYRTRSVPLERISDLQVGCSWVERYFNIRSLLIRDMTGEAQGGARMQGLKDIQKVQELILNEVRRVNLQSSTTAPVTPQSEPAELQPALSESTEVVRLLQEIRDALHKGSTLP